MNVKLELDIYEGQHLLEIGIYRAGRSGNGMELHISKKDYEEFKKLGVKSLAEDE